MSYYLMSHQDLSAQVSQLNLIDKNYDGNGQKVAINFENFL